MLKKRIGFVGGGMMAEAMLGGLLKADLPADNVLVSEPDAKRRKYVADTFKVGVKDFNHEVCAASDVVVMAVKPQVLDQVLADLKERAAQDPKVADCLIISIVAGKTLENYKKYLLNTRVARVMPNTPSLVGCGASCYVLNDLCPPEDAATVEAVMGSCGIVERVGNEGLLDAVTGLSGSGPAYAYLLIEAMSDGGVRMGLPRATATRLAAQTVMGAGKMVMETGKHPGELKDAVTSPGGTTKSSCVFRSTLVTARLDHGTKSSGSVHAVPSLSARQAHLGVPSALAEASIESSGE